MIAAGGLLHCMDAGIDIPGKVGLAGFNGMELLDGLPKQIATINANRQEIGRAAAKLVAGYADGTSKGGQRIVLEPALKLGDTLKRR